MLVAECYTVTSTTTTSSKNLFRSRTLTQKIPLLPPTLNDPPPMPQDTQTLRVGTGARVLCFLIYLAGLVLLTVHLPFDIPEQHRMWVVPSFAILGAFFLADICLSRIILASDNLRVFSIINFQSRTFARAEIDDVTWEKGGGASLKLHDGRWVRLPSVGRNAQGLANSIRAWLKRTAV